jgi:hypothetical protein
MNMKKAITLVICGFTFLTSFGQDSLNAVLRFHFSAGGSFLKNIKTEYLDANVPFTFVEGGIEIGRKFNLELNVRRVVGSVDTLNLNFTKVHFGVNNKSRLNKDLALVLRLTSGVVFENGDYKINRATGEKRISFLKIGTGLEQRLLKKSMMMVNVGYDISKNDLFSGWGISVGVKVGIRSKKENDVPYFKKN